MTTTNLPLVRVRGPGDLAQAIPYLLGFHPKRSLVLVGLADSRVVVSARMDLDDVAEVGEQLVRTTMASMCRGGAQRLVGMVFDDSPSRVQPDDLPWAGLAATLHRCGAEQGVPVDDVGLVSRSSLWSYDCTDPRCCPPEGRSLGPTSEAAVAATFAGLVALPDRAALAAQLDPVPERDRLVGAVQAEERRLVKAALAGMAERSRRSAVRGLFAAARDSDQPGAALLDEDRLVRFGVALRSIPVRDSVWVAVDDERLDGRALWRQLGTRLPAPYDAPALFLFGWASYRHGDGALAGIATDRAIESDPGYTAADLLNGALTQAIDPRQLPRLRRGASSLVRPATAVPPAARPGAAGRTRR